VRCLEMTKVSSRNSKKIAGNIVSVVGFLMILANALDYVLGWDANLVPLLIIGLVLVAVGLGLSTNR
ncbi:MAG TPA: hypothetical protein VLA11_00155, partial [Woeseiaceae bacterium]|nr:hypothetical protein [Woeseiaceae bacterium]